MLTTKGLCAAHPVAELTSSHSPAGVSQTGIWSPLLSFSYCYFICSQKEVIFRVFTSLCHKGLLWLALVINHSPTSQDGSADSEEGTPPATRHAPTWAARTMLPSVTPPSCPKPHHWDPDVLCYNDSVIKLHEIHPERAGGICLHRVLSTQTALYSGDPKIGGTDVWNGADPIPAQWPAILGSPWLPPSPRAAPLCLLPEVGVPLSFPAWGNTQQNFSRYVVCKESLRQLRLCLWVILWSGVLRITKQDRNL